MPYILTVWANTLEVTFAWKFWVRVCSMLFSVWPRFGEPVPILVYRARYPKNDKSVHFRFSCLLLTDVWYIRMEVWLETWLTLNQAFIELDWYDLSPLRLPLRQSFEVKLTGPTIYNFYPAYKVQSLTIIWLLILINLYESLEVQFRRWFRR